MLSPSDLLDATCVTCPGQHLPLGAFDVAARPDPSIPYEPAAGHRISTLTGAPTCVHPFRVELPPGAYRSAGTPLPSEPPPPPPPPADPVPPDDPTLLEAWLIAQVRGAPAADLVAALRRAEAAALRRFDAHTVLTALRRVLR